MQDIFYLDVEADYGKTHWCRQFLSGLTRAAKRRRASLITLADSPPERHAPIIILLGTSSSWFFTRLSLWSGCGARCVLVSFPLMGNLPNVSHVCMDYGAAVRALISHLHATGRRRIALLGANPSSVPDRMKLEGFVSTLRAAGAADPEAHVFYNTGCIDDACSLFLERAGEYDSVICVNDVLSLALSRRLGQAQGDIHIAAFGTSPEVCSGLNDLRITTVLLDFEQVGRQAFNLCRMLSANPELSSVSAFVSCKIHAGEGGAVGSAAGADMPSPMSADMPAFDFYSDAEAGDILRMEQLMSGCDELDFSIIRALTENKTYRGIAEELFISESTVNYRLKKLFSVSGTASKESFLAFWTKYRSK